MPLRDAGELRKLLEPAWAESSILITGATGFLGRWMLDTLLAAQPSKHKLTNGSRRLTTLVRCKHGIPHETCGDVNDYWPVKKFSLIVHCCPEGTENIAKLAARDGAKLLLCSSGAVYGPICAPALEGGALLPDTEYGKRKLAEESLYANSRIARLFTFVGPGLRRHTGAEFLADSPIRVLNPVTVRSYMYAQDAAEQLWAVALHGKPGRPYNIGSPEAVSVMRFAALCSRLRGVAVEAGTNPYGNYYVPNTDRVRTELGCKSRVGLEEAVERTIAWRRANDYAG
jgi:dTDP-glucose 4,6-dehydratase